MKRLTRVYIAGKLNDTAVSYLNNVHQMMETAEVVRQAGFSVFIPAVDLLCGIKHGYDKYEDYFDNGQPWLMAADAVFLVPGWETSDGVMSEIETAKKLNIPVFDDLTEMIDADVDGTLQRIFVDELGYEGEEKVEAEEAKSEQESS